MLPGKRTEMMPPEQRHLCVSQEQSAPSRAHIMKRALQLSKHSYLVKATPDNYGVEILFFSPFHYKFFKMLVVLAIIY